VCVCVCVCVCVRVQTRLNALECIDRLLDSLDKMIILDDVLPFLTDIQCSDVDIIMSIVGQCISPISTLPLAAVPFQLPQLKSGTVCQTPSSRRHLLFVMMSLVDQKIVY